MHFTLAPTKILSVYCPTMSTKIFAILTDIHSNVPSLLKAISIIDAHQHVDQLICLGDYFALGPNPKRTLEILQSLDNCIFIRGNHDRYLIERLWEQELPSLEGMDPYDPVCQGIVANEKWTAEQLGSAGVDFVRETHIFHREVVHDTLVEFTHAWYQRDDQPPSMTEALNWRNHVKASHDDIENYVFVHGHVHIPRFDTNGDLKILCQGATGLPFDRDKRGAVAFLTVGETFEWDVVRYEYDHLDVIRRLEEKKPPFYKNLQNTIRHASIRNNV